MLRTIWGSLNVLVDPSIFFNRLDCAPKLENVIQNKR